MIFDISGHPVHTQRIYYGQNNVDMTGSCYWDVCVESDGWGGRD